MKIYLAFIEAFIVILGITIINQLISNAIDYMKNEVENKHIKTFVITVLIEGILVGLKYYLEILNL